MPLDPFVSVFADGYAAGLNCESVAPYLPFTFAFWLWHCGNATGHQALCAQQEAIFLNFPQD